jgi:hypothetical protein
MSKPVALFNQPNKIFLELSHGKIGKDHKVTVQKGQKGESGFFYAMKRLLTTEQIRSDHGQICSLRRKMITLEETQSFTPVELLRAREKVNEVVLRAIGLDPKKIARAHWIQTLKKGMAHLPAEEITTEQLERVMTRKESSIMVENPWFNLQCLELAINQLMARGHGLREIPCKSLSTIEELISALQQKGPLMIAGRFGKAAYGGKNPIQFAMKVGSHALYGWDKGTPLSKNTEVYHWIVLVGAEIKADRQYVYWIDPIDPNDPSVLDSPRIYVSSFGAISSCMSTIDGLPMHQIGLQSRAVIGGALYNPVLM